MPYFSSGQGRTQEQDIECLKHVMGGLLECHEWGIKLVEPGRGITSDRAVVGRMFSLVGASEPEMPVADIATNVEEFAAFRGIKDSAKLLEQVEYLGTMSREQAMRETISLESGIPAFGRL